MSEKLKFCPDCWENLENVEWKFCPNCGFKIPENNLENEKENNVSIKKIENLEKNIEKKNEEKIENIAIERVVRWKIEEKNNGSKNFLIIIIWILLAIFWYLLWTWKINFWDKKENNSWTIETQSWKTNSWNIEKNFTGEIEKLEVNSWELEKEDKKDETENIEEKIRDVYWSWFYWISKIKSERAFFYNLDWEMNDKKSYVMAWDFIVNFDVERNLSWYFYACYYNKNWAEICWYIKEIDIEKASINEIENEIKRFKEIDKKTTSIDKDEEYKNFLISHYNEIKNKNYYTAFHNYQYPKAKNVEEFASWYKWVYEINLSEIQKIWESEYKYTVSIYSDSWLNKIETSIKVWEVDWKIKILWYGTKKIN